jgi:hypothetical protein
MSAAAKKAISKSVKVTDGRSGTVTHYPSEVTVATSGNLVVNITGLLGTAAAKRQIDVLRELAEIEQKKEK